MRFLANESTEDYLTTVYRMQQNGEVRSKQLIDYLKVKKSSVSEMLSKLSKKKLLSHSKYASIKLTKKGEYIARKILFKHRVIELFLVHFLNNDKAQVHQEAHKLEHAFSDESIKKLYGILGKPRTGVHGEEIKQI